MNIGHTCYSETENCVQIGEHHIVDASSEEEMCTLAKYVVHCRITTDNVVLLHCNFTRCHSRKTLILIL